MLDGDDVQVERLNEAIDELVAGSRDDDVASRLPPSLQPLLAAAASLLSVRHRPGPRPSFVLGLEEQLRADLRLAPTLAESAAPAVPHAGRTRRLIAALAVLTVALSGAWLLAPDGLSVGPNPAILFGGAADTEAGITGSRAEGMLDLAWQRLLALEAELSAVHGDVAVQEPSLIDDFMAAYADALEAIAAEGDARLARRAASELRVAKQIVTRVGARESPPLFVAGLALAVSELDALIERADSLANRDAIVVLSGLDGTSLPAPTIVGSTQAETAAAATAEAVTGVPPTPVMPTAASSVAPPVATATLVPTESSRPTSTTSVAATATVAALDPQPRPTRRPPSTSTPSGGADPGGTSVKPTPTNTPDANRGAATVTPDAWPVTTTSLPPTTDPMIVATSRPGQPATAAPPTPDSTALAPPLPEPTRSGPFSRP